jgi:peroxiredoxin
MKNYLIASLIAVIVFMGTVIYRQQHTMVLRQFPVPAIEKAKDSTEPMLYLFLFFSKKGCKDCSDEVIDLLNQHTDKFQVIGVVPAEELEKEEEIRNEKGITFPLHSFASYRNFLPPNIPALFCISPSGKIVFTLPVFRERTKELESLLKKVYEICSSFASN